MKRVDAAYHVGNLFQSGNPLTGQRGTRIDGTWLNAVQEEIAKAIEAAGISLDPGDDSQLSKAIRKIALPTFSNIAEATAIDEATLLPAEIQTVYVKGRNTEGVGGANYERVAVEPEHDGKYQDAAGQWWEISARRATPEMFGAVGDARADDATAINLAANYCRAAGALLEMQGDYRAATTLNLRHVPVDAPDARIIVDHDDIGVILGGNSNDPNNPTQVIGHIDRDARYTATAAKECRIVGAKGQHIVLHRCDRCELYADTDDPLGSSIAYSTFWLKSVWRVYLNTNPAPYGNTTQWINENRFHLNRTRELYIDGTYSHNHNIFEGGTFEVDGIIRISKGWMNIVRNVRAEGTMQEVSFAANTQGNMVIGSWWGSGLRLHSNELTANVTDDGDFNIVTTEQAIAAPLRPLCGFTHESLIESASVPGKYNIANVSNVTLGAATFSVKNWTAFYASKRMPVRPESDIFVTLAEGVSSGGFRISVNGYDSAGYAIASSGKDVFVDGSGPVGFGIGSPATNTNVYTRLWVTNANCAFVTITASAGGSGLVAEEFALAVHSNDMTRAVRMAAAASSPNI